jgi:multidrug efflux pump subunit AcrA (membrane-fusion protein)
MNKIFRYALLFCLASCSGPKDKVDDSGPAADARTPVTITHVSRGTLTDYVDLNAVSSFLRKSFVKATANGFLQTVSAAPGQFVQSGQPLFTLKTKEAQSIGNAIGQLDSTLRFSGLISIHATDPGFVTQLNHQAGDYVQDGEPLATISDVNSFVFLLDLPYEYRNLVLGHRSVELDLPDGEKLEGAIASLMPTVDATSQTQSVVIRVHPPHSIPENLIAKVHIVKSQRQNEQSLPKLALLTNETQDAFWIMKMIDSDRAAKVWVRKGLETQDRVGIDSPQFSATDRILLTGNYGLPDTARVLVEADSVK